MSETMRAQALPWWPSYRFIPTALVLRGSEVLHRVYGVSDAHAVRRAEKIANKINDEAEPEWSLPLHRTEVGYPRCATCDGGGCPDCTEVGS